MATVENTSLQLRMSYNKLWNLLKARNLRKQDLQRETHISSGSIAKLAKGANIQTNTLLRICQFLDCDIADICEAIPATRKGETK
ncbi:MAG: helix-turn-helix transcriptional regulator [Schaalia turicensis]|nr:helix-turn-helix transcriptional regulator [Schaalia turicensis]